MALLVDTSVFVECERSGREASDEIARLFGEADALAAITAAELLVGVLFATPGSRREARRSLVEAVLARTPVIRFDLAMARVHAQLTADLRRAGRPIGTHDIQIAATAIVGRHTVLTANVRDFDRIPGLSVRRWPVQ